MGADAPRAHDQGVTLREYFERLMEEHDRADQARDVAAQRALDKASDDLSKRLDSMNQFRAQLTEQSKTFMTVATYEAKHDALIQRMQVLSEGLDKRARDLELAKANLEGRLLMIGGGMTLLNIGLTILGLYLRR